MSAAVTTSSPPPISLRPLTLANAPDLQTAYESSGDYFRAATGQEAPSNQAWRDLEECAASEGRALLGIYLRQTLVGVIDLRLAEPEPFDARLALFLLAEPYRRQGLGGWALRILEAWLRQATPTEAVVLTVLAQDHDRQRFFLGHGYTFTGQALRTVTGEVRSRLLFMRKSLQE